eukprot:TRINITY_DN6095_c0_g4_i1.p1 TRINITY_DN6095_c0_g4~~TRINITY_DN6095_c0_g4_i1.p1  ORF type:complete len:622 (+),score=66.95 TRINITY_DN6095_c0_g4_i1:105-1970(+)
MRIFAVVRTPGCFVSILTVLILLLKASYAQNDFCAPLKLHSGNVTIESRVIEEQRPHFNTTWEDLYQFCEKLPTLHEPKVLYHWGSLDVCVKYHLQGYIDQASMDFMLSRDQIGASGGFYNSDNDQDSSQFGSCLTITTVPTGTPLIDATNEIIYDTFRIGDRRLIAALGTFVPFLYYYRPAQPWSSIYNISILQNVTGIARIVPSVSNWKTILSLPPDWLASLLPNPTVNLLRQSFDVVKRYMMALTNDDWLPLLAAVANTPSLPPSEAPSKDFLSIFGQLLSHPGDPASVLFKNYFGNYKHNKTAYQNDFPTSVVENLFGMRLFWGYPEPQFRTAPSNMSHWTSKYGNNTLLLPGAAVELLQKIPFLWVDATPIGSETYAVQLHPVDAYSIEGWIKMNKLGLISPSLQAQLENSTSDRSQLTTELVQIALQDLAGRIFESSVAVSAPIFRTIKFLLPANQNLVSFEAATRIFEWTLLWASDDKIKEDLDLPSVAFSDILALSMERGNYAKLSQRTSLIMLDLLQSLLSTAVFVPINQGRALTYLDVAQGLSHWNQLADSLNSASAGRQGCPIRWPDSFQNPSFVAAVSSGRTLDAFDILFCNRQGWASSPSQLFNWRNH